MRASEVDQAIDLILAVHCGDRQHIRSATRLLRGAFAGQRPVREILAELAPAIIIMLDTEYRASGVGGDIHLASVFGQALSEWGRTGYNRDAATGIAKALLAYLQPSGLPDERVVALLESMRHSLKQP